MPHVYSHSYHDPETGQLVDVLIQEDDAAHYRNAAERSGSRIAVPRRGVPTPRSRGQGDRQSTRAIVVRQPDAAPVSDDYFRLKKDAIVEIVPLVGKVWSSFLGRPDMPTPTGDHIVDRENAALHRDALAQHQQAQHRIEALSQIAGRALDMLLR